MRKFLLLLLAVASLTAAGAVADSAATTASQTVTISHTGYVPTAVSITAGDAVVFTNGDTVAHTVSFNSTTGMQCSIAVPLVLQAGQSATCTFSSAGKFNFSDPANKRKSFRGSVSVTAPLTATFTVKPKAVVYGHKAALAGTLASLQSGQSLQVLAQQCGQSAQATLGTVTTTTGGVFSFQTQPLRQTAYAVKLKSSTSSAVTVKVRPRLRLGKVAHHRYVLRVFAAQSFAGKYATFQRYLPARKRWRGVKRVLLQANGAGVAPTVISSTAFRSGIRARLRVRVVLGSKQVGSCYLAGRSNVIRS